MDKKQREEKISEYLVNEIDNLRSLKFSENYIKTSIENYSKWAKTGLMDGITDTNVGRNMATLFENQKIHNENSDARSAWKRVSIPVLRRVFGNFAGNDLVSVQAVKRPEENVYTLGFDGRSMAYYMEATDRVLPVSYDYDHTSVVDLRLDHEAEMCAKFSRDLQEEELSRMIIRDLATNCGKFYTSDYQSPENLLSLIEGLSSYIGTKCYGTEANWIVTTPKIANLLKEEIKDYKEPEYGVQKVGNLRNWKFFVDKTAPEGNILLGLKENHMLSGYIFSPYLMHEPKENFVFKFGKKMVNPNFYGALKIQNLPLDNKEAV